MDKTAIKNFAIWARKQLIKDIKYKAGLLGVTDEKIEAPLPQSNNETQYFAVGTNEPFAISGRQINARAKLVEAIRSKEMSDGSYKAAYDSIMEAAAYTWFNRFIAVRFMEVNDYLPCRMRVFSAVDGRQEPDIVRNPLEARLEYTEQESRLIRDLQLDNRGDELFNILFIKVCNDLSAVLPMLFESQDDYTELLLNISYINQDGVIYKLVHDIPEDNFDVNAVDEEGKPVGQVEIIGWLYQYYNTEPKNETFALLKKNVKITKERIPSATQLFTPDWIVRYMVENSLGRLWYEGHPESADLKEEWKYYLDEAQQEEAVQDKLAKIKKEYAKLCPEEIKLIDPCMGSGHILVYAFDVLMQIYTQMGYTDKDAVISILENNLYGLDIDKRAFQLAYFAVLMKAREYHKFILKKQPACHIYAIAESNGINMQQLQYFGAQLDELARPVALNQMQELMEVMHDAKEYGSIINVPAYDWALLRQFVAEFDTSGEMNMFDTFGIEATQKKLMELINVGEVLAQKYEVVVTNPPYMGASGMGEKLSKFVKQNYPDTKSDMSTVMMEKTLAMCSDNGFMSMINIPVWMFLSSYEKLRNNILKQNSYVNMLHFGRGVFGSDFGTTAFVIAKKHTDNYIASYRRLFEKQGAVDSVDVKEQWFFEGKGKYVAKQENFAKIPGAPVAYWVSENVIDLFGKNKISDIASAKSGMTTTNNERFLRFWFEVEVGRIGFDYKSIDDTVDRLYKWFPFCKGGDFRRWAGNECYVVNWFNNGEEIRKAAQGASGGRLVNIDSALQKSIVWTKISSSIICLRYKNTGLFFSDAAPGLFSDDEKLLYILGLMNTKYAMTIINLINPTLNFVPGTIASIPIIDGLPCISEVTQLVQQNISLSKTDWDSFETSWDFSKHPLLRNKATIKEAYAEWEAECDERFNTLKANEEELNRIFIDIYGLQDELTAEVEDKDVTVRKADLQRDIKSLLSYAVGCMFGRYSLDVEGLAYAGGSWDDSKYVTFKPDEDNVIPITDEDYFEDDIVGRLIAWLKVVYGAETLEDNLRFIADALGNAGDTPRQKIRNYFLKDFFKDHCKIYQKRPIYWLYDSGKQNGFKALIYMHRYDADTTGRVNADYLGRMEQVYDSEIKRMRMFAENSTGREAAQASKRIEKMQKQLKECRDYSEYTNHIALRRIEIELDDGVKVNYPKVQTSMEGKVLPILAKI